MHHLRNVGSSLYGVGILLAGIPAAVAQSAVTVPVSQSACIQAAGPRQGDTAARYFNVEGKANTGYADYGVLRFDAAGVKSGLDKQFGAGKYRITGVHLRLTQSNARFTKDGGVVFYFTPDDKTDINGKSSPLKYPYDPKGAALKGEALLTAKFAKQEGGAAPAAKPAPGAKPAPRAPAAPSAVDDYDLLSSKSAQKSLVAHLLMGKQLTLVVAEQTPEVAATWAGQTPAADRKPPTLVVTAARR